MQDVPKVFGGFEILFHAVSGIGRADFGGREPVEARGKHFAGNLMELSAQEAQLLANVALNGTRTDPLRKVCGSVSRVAVIVRRPHSGILRPFVKRQRNLSGADAAPAHIHQNIRAGIGSRGRHERQGDVGLEERRG